MNKDGEAKFTLKNATSDSKKVLAAVRDLCNGVTQRITLPQMVEVLIGSFGRKITSKGFDKSTHHGILKQTWKKNNIRRLLNLLVIKKFLHEQLTSVGENKFLYLKLGFKKISETDQIQLGLEAEEEGVAYTKRFKCVE